MEAEAEATAGDFLGGSFYSITEVGSQLNPELVCSALTNQPVFVSPHLCLLSCGITGGPLHCLDIYVGSGDDLHSAHVL